MLFMSDLTITVNDKAYKIADMGLTQISMITLFLVIAATLAGVIIIVCMTAYCRSTRVREANILRCLGMRAGHVRAMLAIEMVMIIGLAGGIGTLCGGLLSKTAIDLVAEGYIANMEERAREPVKVLSVNTDQRAEVLSYPIRIRFGESKESVSDAKDGILPSKAYLPQNMIGIRYESFIVNDPTDFKNPFYAETDEGALPEQIKVTGRSDIPSDGSVTAEMLLEKDRKGGMTVPCTVGQESGYAVGDMICISRQALAHSVRCMGTAGESGFYYASCVPAYAYLTVSEVVEGHDITVSMTDLELLCSYLGASSEVYRSIRYDECITKGN